jgi:type VI secretion system protein ImpJ
MRPLSRLVWSEGMHLAQHHFQAQNRYFEHSIGFALQHLFPASYGLLGCELDGDALHNGVVALLHARGVMPDGLAFHFPDCDPLPPSRDIRELFLPTEQSRVVILAVPPYREDGRNCALDGSGVEDLRYIGEELAVSDETTGIGTQPVRVGRKNFRLLLDTEGDAAAVRLPIARVRRDGSGHFVYDPEYVPPCLQIGASRRIVDLLARLTDILAAQSDALAGARREGAGDAADPAQQVARLWMLHTIHSSLGPLRHHLTSRRSSPEQVYTDLARLAGALCTFTLDTNPRDLPPYDHDHLEQCFTELDRWIRANLEVVAPSRCVTIPLTRSREFLFTGTVEDARALHPSRWILEVALEHLDPNAGTQLPRLLKVCAAKHIVRLVKEGLPGLVIEHLAVPPAEIPVRSQRQYFAVSLDGPCWAAIVKSSEVGVYTPDTAAVKELNVLAVL